MKKIGLLLILLLAVSFTARAETYAWQDPANAEGLADDQRMITVTSTYDQTQTMTVAELEELQARYEGRVTMYENLTDGIIAKIAAIKSALEISKIEPNVRTATIPYE